MARSLTTRGLARGLAAAVVVIGALVLFARWRSVAAELARPRELHGGAFAGAAACGACHPDRLASWRRTYHRTMTQEVSPAHPEAAVGDFSGASYLYDGVSVRMHRDGEGRPIMTFWRAGTAAPPVDAVVVRAVGSRRYQQYLTEVDGVLWRLPMAFHIEERRWFHMNGAFLTPDPDGGSGLIGGAGPWNPLPPAPSPSSDALQPRPRIGGGAFDRHVTRWNDNCVFCHNVAPNPGWDATTATFRTTVAELGIACEACHGPGAAHVDANKDPLRRFALHLSSAPDPSIVNPARLSPGRAADVCGRCHGQRLSDDLAPILAHGDPFVPGDDLALYTSPLWRDTPLRGDDAAFATRFWDDGTPRLTAYEYQGLLQSACSTRGTLTCTTCHGMHDGDPRGQVRPAARGDGACTGCHVSLSTTTARAAHTLHDPAGPGSRCISCHMPRIVYGVLDTHLSHRIEVPDPARASAMDRPDACTLCHVDADRAWAVRERDRLWPSASGAARASLRGTHPHAPEADWQAPMQALFAGDPVARVVAADAIGRAPWPADPAVAKRVERSRAEALLAAMSDDRYPAVRHLAARALERLLLARSGSSSVTELRQFDATGAPAARALVVGRLRERWPWSRPSADAGTRLAGFRKAAREADIDIGE